MADSIAADVYKNKTISDKNRKALFAENFTQLNEGVESGFGQSYVKVEYGTPNQKLLKNLRFNVGVFAAFKNHSLSKELVKNMLDENGALKPRAKFLQDAKPIVGNYNENYLTAERVTAVRSARTATIWQRALEVQHLYPNLKYVPSRTSKPRDAHRALWGIIRPINDPFWDTYMPPSAWRCQCSISSTDETPTGVPDDLPAIDPVFANNPGKTGMVFNYEHPYFKMSDPELTRVAREAQGEVFRYETGELLAYARENIIGKTVSLDTDNGTEEIGFSRKSFEKNLKYGSQFMSKLHILYNIREMLKQSTFVKFEPNYKRDVKPDVKGYYVYQMKAANGQYIRFKVEKNNNGSSVLYFIETK